jgi:hypothetical protein
MGIRESLRELREKEKLSVKREVKKEMTKIRKQLSDDKRCMHCNSEKARYYIKGSSDGYCKECAKELFGELGYLSR